MRRRILTAIVGVVALATAILTAPLAVIVASRNQARAVLELERAAERTAAALPPDIGDPTAPIVLPDEEKALDVAVYDRAGRKLLGVGPARADAITARPGLATRGGAIAGEQILARPITVEDRRVATVRVAEPTSEAARRTGRDLVILILVDLLAVGIAAAVGSVLAKRLALPLGEVRDDAVRLGHGDFAVAARTSGVAEIDETSESIAETARRLDAVLQRERTFSANASHQLRTPVTSMRLAVESDLAVPREDARAVLYDVLRELDRLESTIDALLAVARDLPRRSEPVDLADVLGRLEARWEGLLTEEGRTLSLCARGGVAARISPQIFDEILDVLVDNARRHGTGLIDVEIDTGDPQHLLATVTDEGQLTGEVSSLFLRRQPGAAHHGIGLALARSLAEAEGGRLILLQRAPTTFRLLLPPQA